MNLSTENLEWHFAELLGESLSEEISLPAEIYVLDLLTDLSSGVHSMAPRSIFLKDLLRSALKSKGLARREYLRVTGDVALFVSGIFPDSFEREHRKIGFNLGDYIDIGQTAYSYLDTEVYEELSIKFPQVVEVLNSLSININLTSIEIDKYIKRRRQIDARIARG